jgi:hypothetical protein
MVCKWLLHVCISTHFVFIDVHVFIKLRKLFDIMTNDSPTNISWYRQLLVQIPLQQCRSISRLFHWYVDLWQSVHLYGVVGAPLLSIHKDAKYVITIMSVAKWSLKVWKQSKHCMVYTIPIPISKHQGSIFYMCMERE